ncbi:MULTISPECIES: YitT family protein [Vibrio]|uniref:YitT family protein n=1 Tax=Vibrio ostreae TaxID=2841925 RepID=A0A975YNW5_9VIBR|nr:MULTISPECIES: YitT family protein [Vibrio]QXO18197.1 YitT family protein [Vibrio ostreae]WGY47479.1 YitT family protein [Vibrio sp. ABG19]
MSGVAVANTHHKWFEDAMALVMGTSLVAFGVLFLKQVGMVTGGTAGLSLFLSYHYHLEFGTIFFLVNLPFYYLALRRMGWLFCLKTFTAVGLVSFITNTQSQFIQISNLNPIYAAIFGGFLFGTGFIILFRHKASLGGFNILALYVQDRFGLRAGWLLMGIDLIIMLVSLSVVGLYELALSVVCGLVLNLIIALNHRSDRYQV